MKPVRFRVIDGIYHRPIVIKDKLVNEYERLMISGKPFPLNEFIDLLTTLQKEHGEEIYISDDEYDDRFCVWVPETPAEQNARTQYNKYKEKDKIRQEQQKELMLSLARQHNIEITNIVIN